MKEGGIHSDEVLYTHDDNNESVPITCARCQQLGYKSNIHTQKPIVKLVIISNRYIPFLNV